MFQLDPLGQSEAYFKITQQHIFYHSLHRDDLRYGIRATAGLQTTNCYYEAFFFVTFWFPVLIIQIKIVECTGEIGFGLAPAFFKLVGCAKLGRANFQITHFNLLGESGMSTGYYSDGHVFAESGHHFNVYSPYTTGDVVGCGVFDGKFFVTKNGKFLGIFLFQSRFQFLKFLGVGYPNFKSSKSLYPTITVKSVGTKLVVISDVSQYLFSVPSLVCFSRIHLVELEIQFFREMKKHFFLKAMYLPILLNWFSLSMLLYIQISFFNVIL